MLSAKEYIEKIIELRKQGRHDLIHAMALKRARYNREVREKNKEIERIERQKKY